MSTSMLGVLTIDSSVAAPLRKAFAYCGTFGAYFLASWLGLYLHTVSGFAAPIWPATGIAIAAIYLLGYRLWPSIFVAATLVNYLSGASLGVAAVIGLGNTLEALTAVYLLKQYLGFSPTFARLRDSLAFIFVSIVSPLVSATLGVGALFMSGAVTTDAFYATWGAWWTGDAIGALIVGAFSVRTFLRRPTPPARAKAIETFLAFAVLIILSYIAFFSPYTALARVPAFYLFLPLSWIAIRLRFRSISAAMLITSVIGAAGTLSDSGIFGTGDLTERILLLQTLMGTLACIFFSFTSTVEERRVAETKLAGKVGALEENLTKSRFEDRAKNEFIAVLAHELRNPLAPIVSTLELLKIKRTDEEDAQAVRQAEEQAHMMRRLLDDLLDISRITQQKLKLHKELTTVQSAVERSAHAVKTVMKTYGHDLSLSMPKRPIWVHADPIRLSQIFGNILYNAAKYTPPGGKIELTVTRSRDIANVTVKDNGIGIGKDELHRIFEPFVSIPSDLSRVGTGLGIGLALTRTLAELHGGTVDASSRGRGHGSTFTVKLPTVEGPPARLPQEHMPQHTLFPLKILIVDDNRAAAEGLQKLLSLRGHATHVVHDAKSALSSLGFDPDVVLLDIGLPDATGYEVASAMKAEKGFRAVLIAVSGYGQPDDLKKAWEAGFDHHCTKPVSLVELESLFAEIGSGKKKE